jgi:hypothetical protein
MREEVSEGMKDRIKEKVTGVMRRGLPFLSEERIEKNWS